MYVNCVECLKVSSNSVVYQEIHLVFSSFHLIIPSLSQGTFFLKKKKRCVRKMVYGVFRSIGQCRWDCGNTASDLAVSLFRFRHSASSIGLAALLAKPQSNHLNLLCALRGHPVTLSEALNMCSTIHIRPDTDGKYKITSTEVSVVCFGALCHVRMGN